jgi:hypothetical protein
MVPYLVCPLNEENTAILIALRPIIRYLRLHNVINLKEKLRGQQKIPPTKVQGRGATLAPGNVNTVHLLHR